MKKFVLMAGALALAPFGAANAATTVTAVAATNPYSGPTPTYDFDLAGPAPISGGGSVRTGSVPGVARQPTGSTGQYYAVGGNLGGPAILDLSSFGEVGTLSLLWGTMDDYNTLDILDDLGGVLFSRIGSELSAEAGSTAALVTFQFTGATRAAVDSVRFSSSDAAFEFDNINVVAVPEPGVWMMMLLGFAAVGFSLRSRKKPTVRVRYT